MYYKRKKSGLEHMLYRGFILISTPVILLSLGGTLYFDVVRQQEEMDTMISGTAAYISRETDMVTMLESGYPSPYVKQSLNALYAVVPNIGAVEVCNKDGVRSYHTDRQSMGESYIDGEGIPVLQGGGPYTTVGYGIESIQWRVFYVVHNAKGEVIGFVMISAFVEVIFARVQSIALVHLTILGVILIIGFSLSHVIPRIMRKTLMGFQPKELLHRCLRQDVVLSAVVEGLVINDTAGTVLFASSAARGLIGEDKVFEEWPISELLPDARQETVLRIGQPKERRSWAVGGHSVLVNEVLVRKDDGSPAEGVLTTLYDRIEMLHTSDELFGARGIADALCSHNHEFSNRLHMILGYLETGQIEQAIDYIVNSSLTTGQVICQAAGQIRMSEFYALVAGKMMYVAEQGIQPKLMGDSHYIEQDFLTPVDDTTTIVGNLLESAIEDLNLRESELRGIKFGLYCRPDYNILVCKDTDRNIPHGVMEYMFEKGFPIRGKHHGTDLYLVCRIVRQYGGRTDIETEGGGGTVFTITFTRGG